MVSASENMVTIEISNDNIDCKVGMNNYPLKVWMSEVLTETTSRGLATLNTGEGATGRMFTRSLMFWGSDVSQMMVHHGGNMVFMAGDRPCAWAGGGNPTEWNEVNTLGHVSWYNIFIWRYWWANSHHAMQDLAVHHNLHCQLCHYSPHLSTPLSPWSLFRNSNAAGGSKPMMKYEEGVVRILFLVKDKNADRQFSCMWAVSVGDWGIKTKLNL